MASSLKQSLIKKWDLGYILTSGILLHLFNFDFKDLGWLHFLSAKWRKLLVNCSLNFHSCVAFPTVRSLAKHLCLYKGILCLHWYICLHWYSPDIHESHQWPRTTKKRKNSQRKRKSVKLWKDTIFSAWLWEVSRWLTEVVAACKSQFCHQPLASEILAGHTLDVSG